MKAESLALPEVKLLTPDAHGDDRGFFLESFNSRTFAELGLPTTWAQDNHSRSAKNVLRGLHYQLVNPQGKLVRVATGAVFDVAVDLRRSSPRFGQWAGALLTADNHQMLYIPPMFAHGFLVVSETADFLYKCTTIWHPQSDHSLSWADPDVAINWPLDGEPLLAAKDRAAPMLADAKVFP